MPRSKGCNYLDIGEAPLANHKRYFHNANEEIEEIVEKTCATTSF